MRRWLIPFFLVMSYCASANGQTTQPAADLWQATVDRFAASLQSSDESAMLSVVAPDCSVRTFQRQGKLLADLLDSVRGASRIGSHLYGPAAATIAQDVAADVAASNAPEALKRKLALDDGDARNRANATAQRWVAQLLLPTGSDWVGVIVLLKPADETPESANLIFVLLKGRTAPSGEMRVTQVVYGNPAPASSSASTHEPSSR